MEDGTWEQANGQGEGELYTIEKAEERAEASQLTTSEQEERQTFVITSKIQRTARSFTLLYIMVYKSVIIIEKYVIIITCNLPDFYYL